MNEDMGRQVGETIRVVKECDVQEDDTRWEKLLKLYIEMDLHKLISWGRMLKYLRANKIWVSLIYEKLPKLCFWCGCIVHKQGNFVFSVIVLCINKGLYYEAIHPKYL